jgi:UDP-N-acetylmuramoyl-L-alanyl-D-glutamate--2,6-diaminopimelate ligase
MMTTTGSSRLQSLFWRFPGKILTPVPEVEVSGVEQDSRRVKPGDLFVAVVGESADGHRFIEQAVARGARAVVGSRAQGEIAVPYVRVGEDRLALAYLSAAFHGDPSLRLAVIGVTGTDGKTTTASLISSILKTAGLIVGMISTVGARIGDQELDTGFHTTTPDSPQVQALLASMVRNGVSHAVLEATSHGLVQERLRACDFDVGVVTNVTHEHLDYHASFEDYRAAKGRLFRELGRASPKDSDPPRAAVLNRADESYLYFSGLISVREVTYGDHPDAQVRPLEIEAGAEGQAFTLAGPSYRVPVRTRLPGSYNVLNCLAAASVGIEVFGLDPEAAALGISSLRQLPGRMEPIDLGQDFTAIVDFAHTPNALQSCLEAARGLAKGRVIAVFGSAGLRDREKRRLMAGASTQLADLTVLTAEDPRTESLAEILAEMARGADGAGGEEGKTFWRIPDRRDAIRFAVRLARPGDVVIACGKGHEQSMCFGETEYPWDDRAAMRAAISERLGVSGPAMPELPREWVSGE